MDTYKVKRASHPGRTAEEFLSLESAILSIPLNQPYSEYYITVLRNGSPVAVYNAGDAVGMVESKVRAANWRRNKQSR